METVTPILKPDQAAMHDHLAMLFKRALTGRVEITAIRVDRDGERTPPRTRFFDVDELEEAAEYAASVNAEHLWNVYVGAAARIPDVFPGKAATDEDFHRVWAIHADVDDDHDLEAVREKYRALGITPPIVVVTGRTPTTRAQMWWPLIDPITDADVYRRTLRAVASVLHTDPAVTAAKQLMRLAGGVNWPKKDGRVLEKTEVIHPSQAQQAFSLEQLHRAFPLDAPPQAQEHADERPGTLLGALAARDLRSALASMRADDRDLWVRMGHALKELGEQGRGLWIEWSQTSDKYDPADAARVWDSLHPSRTGYQAVFAEAQRQGWVNPGKGVDGNSRPPAEPKIDPETGEVLEDADADLFEVLSMADLAALPDVEWLVKDTIPAGGLGFIYGPPGSFKSFVCYDMALTLAYTCPNWIGREIRGDGHVLYIANEGSAGARKRISAWQQQHGIAEDNDAFHLIRKSMSFMNADDVAKLERTVAAHVAAHGDVSLIFVDTVSRVLPGADENLQKDMTVFVAACDRLRERFGAAVLGVHHTNKNGDMRGSTVFLGQGDCIFRIEKSEVGRGGVLTCEKQKDAEDGWKKAFDVETMEWMPPGRIEAVSSLVVTWSEEAPETALDPDSKWPRRDVLQALQRAVQDAFQKGAPLSMAPQARRDGRHAPSRLAASHDLSAGLVENIIQTWLDNGVVEVRMVDSHSKMRGLTVVKWLD